MTWSRLVQRALTPLALVALLLSGCGSYDQSSQDYAKLACAAYRTEGRSVTPEQAAALHEVARSNARAAAAFDSRWSQLSADIQSAQDMFQADSDAFFDVDKRVQADCHDAGRDIGNLDP